MAKHSGRHMRREDSDKIIDLGEYGRTEARIEYEDEEIEAEGEERLRRLHIPKAAYRIVVVLVLLVLGLALWLNRDSISLAGAAQWVRLQFTGAGEGDGYPVAVTGSQVSAANFGAHGGNALVLSDTAFTMLDPSGKELLSLRHSLNQPVMRMGGSRSLLYNQGSLGYLVLNGTGTEVNGDAPQEILAGTVAQNGRFALGLRGASGASELNVYQPDGTLQYHYVFSRDYITAIALNYDGSWGLVCTVRTEKGEMVSRLVVLAFDREEPAAEYEVADDLLLDAYWSESGDLFAVGESALLRAQAGSYSFTEYSYDGRKPTAFALGQNRVFLSLSAYAHAGPSTLLVFRGQGDPVAVEAEERIVSLSPYGGTIGALVGGEAVFYDYDSGRVLGRAEAGADAKSIALMNERSAYLLGVSEIHFLEIP